MRKISDSKVYKHSNVATILMAVEKSYDSLEEMCQYWKKNMEDETLSPVERGVAEVLVSIAEQTEMGTKSAIIGYSKQLKEILLQYPNSTNGSVGGIRGLDVVCQDVNEHLKGTVTPQISENRFFYTPPKKKKSLSSTVKSLFKKD